MNNTNTASVNKTTSSFNSQRRVGGLLSLAYSGNIDDFLEKSTQFISFIRKAQKFIQYNEIYPITPDKAITYQTEELERIAYTFLAGLYQISNQYFTYHSNKEQAIKFAESMGFETVDELKSELEKLIDEGSIFIGIKSS